MFRLLSSSESYSLVFKFSILTLNHFSFWTLAKQDCLLKNDQDWNLADLFVTCNKLLSWWPTSLLPPYLQSRLLSEQLLFVFGYNSQVPAAAWHTLKSKTKNMSLQIKSLSTILHNKCWQKTDVDKHQMLSGQIYDEHTEHHWSCCIFYKPEL